MSLVWFSTTTTMTTQIPRPIHNVWRTIQPTVHSNVESIHRLAFTTRCYCKEWLAHAVAIPFLCPLYLCIDCVETYLCIFWLGGCVSIIHIFLDASTFSSCRKFAIFHYTLWLQETTQDTQLSLTYCAVLICSHIARLAPLILRSSSSANLHGSRYSLSSSSRSFRIRAPTIRNSLPSSITTSQAADLFQKTFQTSFF